MLGWGTSFIFFRPVALRFGGLPATVLLYVALSAFMAAFILLGSKKFKAAKSPDLRPLAGAAAFDLTGSVCYNLSVQTQLSAIATAISSLFPAVTVACAVVFLKEKLEWNQWLGIFLVLAALVMISS